MRFIEIIGEGKLKHYDPALFAVIPCIDGTRIFTQSKEFGTWERADWTLEKLEEHLTRQKAEGFTVRELEHIFSK